MAIADPKGTRLTIGLSRPLDYQVFRLANPDRVVIDFADAGVSAPAAPPSIRDGVIERVRVGQAKPNVLRVVVDCAEPVRLGENYLMKPGDSTPFQLVVTILPHGATQAHRPGAGAAGNTLADPPPPPAPSFRPAPPAAKTATAAAAPPKLESGALNAGLTVKPVPRPRTAASPRGSTAGPIGQPAAVGVPGAPLRAAAVTQPSPPPAAAFDPIVVIDPGHGGRDPGAIGVAGTYEKTITLLAARALRDELRRRGGYRVVLTRDRDRYVPLRERVAIARRAGADIFLSIHADAMENNAVRGLSVYTLSEHASDAEAAALAERENKVDVIRGIDLAAAADVAPILIDLTQRQTLNRSVELAGHLVAEFKQSTALLPKPHRFAGFAVLKAPDVPAVLIELGFLSSPKDEQQLLRAEYRRRLAVAAADAIDRYFARFAVAQAR